jgi:uncharacterized protein YndB with AHSA1/START domain
MSTAPDETSVVEHEVKIAASPETVFGYFTDPSRMVQWMGAEATLDPRPGGTCRIAINSMAVASGKFVDVVPYRRVAFSWGWENDWLEVPPASTLVEVSLTPEDDGTLLRLTHRQLPEGTLEFHTRGWGYYVGRLAKAAAGSDPGPDSGEDDEVAEWWLKSIRGR